MVESIQVPVWLIMFLTYWAFVSRFWLLPENHWHLVRSLDVWVCLTSWSFGVLASTFKRCGLARGCACFGAVRLHTSWVAVVQRRVRLLFVLTSGYQNRELGCECGFRGLGICMISCLCWWNVDSLSKLEAGSSVFIIHKILHSEWFGHLEMSDQCKKALRNLERI